MSRKVIWLRACFLTFFVLRPCLLSAETVSVEEARQIAFEYLNKTATKSISDGVKLAFSSLSLDTGTKADIPTFYCFTAERDGGFVIVSADNCVKPILAYSDSGIMPDEANLPAAFKHWLLYIDEKISKIRRNSAENSIACNALWTSAPTSTGSVVVQYETALWDQFAPYYFQCPEDNGVHCVTGCTITAIAIVMRYYKWPLKGNGFIDSYYTRTKSLYVTGRDLNHTYDWDTMLIDYKEGYNDAQSTAVAALMMDLGAALNADYTQKSTAAAINTKVLFENFGYDAGCYQCPKSSYSEEEWENELISRLKNDGPLLYVGYGTAGHVMVIDGMADDGTFHINWGCGGWANGFFALDALSPIEGAYFSYNNSAYFNFVPSDNSSTAIDWLKYRNTGLSSSVESYTIQEPFSLSAGSIWNNTKIDFNGAVRPALVNSRSEIKEWISDEKRVELTTSSQTSFTFDCVISSEMKTGDYIACYYHSDNDDHWYAVKAAYGNVPWKIPVRDPLSIEESTSVQYGRDDGRITITYKDGVSTTARLNGEPILSGISYIGNSLVIDTQVIGKGEYTIILKNEEEYKEFTVNVKSNQEL